MKARTKKVVATVALALVTMTLPTGCGLELVPGLIGGTAGGAVGGSVGGGAGGVIPSATLP